MKEISNEKNVSESGPKKSQVIENPCTQIYEITPRQPISSLEALLADHRKFDLKCPDYGSDEFADVEDNANHSSSENVSGESIRGAPATVSANSLLVNTFPSKRATQRPEIVEEGTLLSKNEAFTSSSSENELVNVIVEGTPEDKNIHSIKKINLGASCSHSFPNSSRREELFVVSKTPEYGKKKNKCSMPTIEEVSENEDKIKGSAFNQASHSKANPLKMKAKVGNRKDKCNVCRVRLGLCAIKCRCGGYYCAKHRYDKEHNCSFDYKSMGAEEIRRNNPRVIAEKIRKL